MQMHWFRYNLQVCESVNYFLISTFKCVPRYFFLLFTVFLVSLQSFMHNLFRFSSIFPSSKTFLRNAVCWFIWFFVYFRSWTLQSLSCIPSSFNFTISSISSASPALIRSTKSMAVAPTHSALKSYLKWANRSTLLGKHENLVVKHTSYLYLPLEALFFDLFHALVAFSFGCLQIFLKLRQKALCLLDQVEALFFEKADFSSHSLPLSMLGFT